MVAVAEAAKAVVTDAVRAVARAAKAKPTQAVTATVKAAETPHAILPVMAVVKLAATPVERLAVKAHAVTVARVKTAMVVALAVPHKAMAMATFSP